MPTNDWWEQRASMEREGSLADFVATLGGASSAADVVVTIESALTVPAVASAVNFLSGEMAGMPLHVFDRVEGEGRERVRYGVADVLESAVNDECSSFDWRKSLFDDVFTGGRGMSWIERRGGEVVNIWPMEPGKTTIRMESGRKVYAYRDGRTTKRYSAAEVIDIPFMLKEDRLSHWGPITIGRDTIGLAIAATQYGSRFFAGGGVPPFAISGNFQAVAAMQRAGDDIQAAVRKAAREKRVALTLPQGLEIKSIGVDPEKSQLIETQRFCIEQIARIYNMPPVMLQDLTNGTFSNTEQQDLHLAKHTLKRWVEQFERELNLKLFGRRERARYVEMNMDGLQRGDFKSRMEGYARGVQTGIYMPSEVRARENLPFVEGSDKLFLQGATQPIDQPAENSTNTGVQT